MFIIENLGKNEKLEEGNKNLTPRATSQREVLFNLLFIETFKQKEQTLQNEVRVK